MVEDYVMASDEAPDDIAEGLGRLRVAQAEIAESLSRIMVGIVAMAGWMRRAGS